MLKFTNYYTAFEKQRGAAIIMALFIVSLVAIAAIAMLNRFQIDRLRAELLFNSTKKMLYAEGSVDWAKEQLNSNWKHQQKNKPIDLLPIVSPEDEIDHVKIASIIDDAQGLFNLNNLVSPVWQESFSHLITIVSPTTDINAAHEITLAVADWVSRTSNNFSYNEFYLKRNPPYRAPHQLMVSVSELRLVKGITPELYAALLPYVTALPETTKINVNDAPAPVLMTLNLNLTANAAKAIVAYRQQNPFATTQAFLQFDVVKNNPIPIENITVVSNYFLVKTSVKVNQDVSILYTLLQRVIKNAESTETILWQSKGSL